MRIPRPARTWAGRRFILVAITLIAVTLTAALAFADWRMEAALRRDARDAMTDEMQALVAIARGDGPVALQTALNVRSRLSNRRFLHLLVNREGRAIAGDLDAWPTTVREDTGSTTFSAQKDGRQITALGVATTLPNGSRLLIATDLSALEAVRADAITAFSIVLAAAVAIALWIGYLFDRFMIARLREIVRTADSVMAGRLDARVPTTESPDEFSGLARTLNAMLDRIEILMQGLRAVTDSLAHDLRTPLIRVRAAIDDALAQDPDEGASALLAARASADQLVQTFETLIDIARAETGLSEEAMTETNLSTLAEDMVELFGPLAEDRDIELTLHAPAECNVRAHRALVGQAIGNLIDNAIKYGHENGAISVTVARCDHGADVTVADDGPGVPQEAVAAAATRFTRLVRSESAPGAGLGLSIVSATARLHGGVLRLENNHPGLRAVLEIRERF